MDVYMLLLSIKQITNKNLLIAQGTLLNTLTYMGIESKKEWINVSV